MNVTRLKLITFDVTDTLLRFRQFIGKQYSEVGALYGINCDKNILASNLKNNWQVMNKEHPNFGKNSGISSQDWWRLIVHRTFKDSYINADDKKLNMIGNHLIEMFQSADSWQQCYGALGLLSYLRNKGIPLGVISNFDETLPLLLEKTNLRHYFKFVLSSYEAGFEKPDLQIFQEALKQSKVDGLESNQCLHIGNTIALDYIGAKDAGWNAFLILDINKEQLKLDHPKVDPRHVYRNLYDVHKYFVDITENKN